MTAPEYRRGAYKQGGIERTEFGSRLRARRRELDITQEELSERIGRSQPCLSQWESGRREPSLSDLANLAKCLEISTDYLVLGSRCAILGATEKCPREAGTSGGVAPNTGGSMRVTGYIGRAAP
jgi:DNA-binding XRE family transcriptional regulator